MSVPIYSGDFSVMFGEEESVSVFYLLEMAFLELGMRISYKSKMRSVSDRLNVYPHFVYHRMLWGKLSLCVVYVVD